MMTSHPLLIRPGFISTARRNLRRHIFLPGTFVPGRRTAVGEEARKAESTAAAMRLPTQWAGLAVGDLLWLKEELAELVDVRHGGRDSKTFFKLDLIGGLPPIPGGARGDHWRTRTVDAKLMIREHSRYHLKVTAVRLCNAQEVTWGETEREGTYEPHSTLGSWWGRWYGLTMPWIDNLPVVGVDFQFIDGNIDTGERWVDPATRNSGAGAVIERMFGTPPIKD